MLLENLPAVKARIGRGRQPRQPKRRADASVLAAKAWHWNVIATSPQGRGKRNRQPAGGSFGCGAAD